jgi:tRNA threonylcarbamoyladenosine biosynthesis protein TsaE
VAVADLTIDELRAWGRRLGASLRAPTIVALSGDLGAGKTTLVQAIATGLGVADEVTSPTYGIVHQHAAPRGALWHFDLYRLKRAEELAQVGWDEALASGGILLVEWPEIAAEMLPMEHIALRLEHVADPTRRRLQVPAARDVPALLEAPSVPGVPR